MLTVPPATIVVSFLFLLCLYPVFMFCITMFSDYHYLATNDLYIKRGRIIRKESRISTLCIFTTQTQIWFIYILIAQETYAHLKRNQSVVSNAFHYPRFSWYTNPNTVKLHLTITNFLVGSARVHMNVLRVRERPNYPVKVYKNCSIVQAWNQRQQRNSVLTN